MNIPNSLDKDRILLRLQTFRIVAEANAELLQKDALIRERFESSVQAVLGYVDELDVDEKSGDEMKYQSALASAELALARVQDLILSILE